VGALKIYVEAVVALRKEGIKLNIPPKLVEKNLFGSQLFCFVKFHSQLRILMPYYAKTDLFRPLIA
jgi:hypothetical protein